MNASTGTGETRERNKRKKRDQLQPRKGGCIRKGGRNGMKLVSLEQWCEKLVYSAICKIILYGEFVDL